MADCICPICGEEANRKKPLGKHLQEKHPEYALKCTDVVIRGITRHHYYCALCGYRITSLWKDLLPHYEKHHPGVLEKHDLSSQQNTDAKGDKSMPLDEIVKRARYDYKPVPIPTPNDKPIESLTELISGLNNLVKELRRQRDDYKILLQEAIDCANDVIKDRDMLRHQYDESLQSRGELAALYAESQQLLRIRD